MVLNNLDYARWNVVSLSFAQLKAKSGINTSLIRGIFARKWFLNSSSSQLMILNPHIFISFIIPRKVIGKIPISSRFLAFTFFLKRWLDKKTASLKGKRWKGAIAWPAWGQCQGGITIRQTPSFFITLWISLSILNLIQEGTCSSKHLQRIKSKTSSLKGRFWPTPITVGATIFPWNHGYGSKLTQQCLPYFSAILQNSPEAPPTSKIKPFF